MIGRGAVLAVLALASLAVYWPTLSDSWIRFDNALLIQQQPRVQALTLEGAERLGALVEMFTTPHGDLYQPLLSLSVAIDYALFDWDRTGWHAHALALHVTGTALFFLLALRLGSATAAAGIAFVLAAVHPVMVETTTWVIHRTILLATVWIALGSHAYLSYLRDRDRLLWLVAATAAYALCLLGKAVPSVLVIPFALDLWVGRRLDSRAFLEKLPLALLVAAIVGGNFLASQAAVDSVMLVRSTGEIVREAPAAAGLNLANLVWPTRLAMFYPAGTASDWLGGRWIAAGIALVLVGVLGGWLWRRGSRGLALGAGLWLALLLPSIAAGAYREVATADRYVYIGTLWLALGLAEALSLAARRGGLLRFASLGCGIALAVPLGLQARSDAELWSDEIALWGRVIERTPHPTAFGAMGNVHLNDRGDRLAAAQAYADAVAILESVPIAAHRPRFLESAARTAVWAAEEHTKRGDGEAASQQLARALRFAARAQQRWPARPVGHFVAGQVHRERGEVVEAARAFGRTAILTPGDPSSTRDFFAALLRLGESGEREVGLVLARDYAARFPASRRAAEVVAVLEATAPGSGGAELPR